MPWLKGSVSHELVEVQIESKTAQNKDQYDTSRGHLGALASAAFSEAKGGDLVAMESQCDAEPFWIVRVVKKHDALSQRREFSDFGSEWTCEARSPAVEVTKAFLTSTQATRTYRDDDRARKFFVPKALLRLRLAPDADYGLKSTRRSNRSRSAVQGAGGAGAGAGIQQPGRWGYLLLHPHHQRLEAWHSSITALTCHTTSLPY